MCRLDRVGRADALASLLSTLRDHDGVRAVFRTGEVRLGSDARQIALLQMMKRGSWWLATCELRREGAAWRPAAGWRECRGAKPASLPAAVAPWVAAMPTETTLTALRANTILPAGIQWLLFAHELAGGVAESLTLRPWPSDVAMRTLTTAFSLRAAALLTGETTEIDGRTLETVRAAVEVRGVRITVRVVVAADAWIGVPPIVSCYALLCGRGVHALPEA